MKYYALVLFLFLLVLMAFRQPPKTKPPAAKPAAPVSKVPPNPQYDALIKAGEGLLKLKNYDSAAYVFRQATKMAPGRVEGHYGLSYSLSIACVSKNINCQETKRELDMVIILKPGYRKSWYNRANYKLKNGDKKGALEDLNRAIAQDSLQIEYFQKRAGVYIMLKDTTATCKDLLKVKKLGGQIKEEWFKNACKCCK